MKLPRDFVKDKGRAMSRSVELLLSPIKHKDTRRVQRRILKYNQGLFTFLDNRVVEPTDNRAEWQLTPIVVIRKAISGNRSALGALSRAAMTSTIQTGMLNGIEPSDIFLALSLKPLSSLIDPPRPRPL